MRHVLHIGGIAGLLLAAGCDRDMAEELCPSVGEGDLVVTEIRGEQTVKRTPQPDNQPIPDPDGEWIELYNATAGSVDLYGLQVRFTELDGSNEGTVIVRRHVDVGAGERVVLSFFGDDARPAYAAYGWFPDFVDADGEPHDLFPTGVVDLYACDTRIERVRPDGLPGAGTWSFPTDPPDAAANDDAQAWCDDGTNANPTTEYAKGTPGEANRPCP